MIKKAAPGQLIQGMFVHDLNCSWLEHPFAGNRFLIKDEATLNRIRQLGVKYVFIDTVRGADLPAAAPSAPEVSAPAETPAEAAAKAESPRRRPPPSPPQIPMLEELERAREVHSATANAVSGLFDDLRRGRPMALGRFDPLIELMLGSLQRNKHALVSLGRLRQLDHYTYEHSVSVSVLLMAFGRDLGMSEDVLHDLALGGMLHDIGKSRVDPAILNKPAALDAREKSIMRSHVSWGERILEGDPEIPAIGREVASQHHERLDGSGYPRQLAGQEISIHGQMAAIADIYDALSTDRSYSSGIEPTESLRRLLEWPEGKLSPTLVQHFIRCVGIYPVGSLVRLASNRLAVVIEASSEALLRPKVRVVYDTKRNCRLPAVDLDLNETGRGEERILNCERVGTCGIVPFAHMSA